MPRYIHNIVLEVTVSQTKITLMHLLTDFCYQDTMNDDQLEEHHCYLKFDSDNDFWEEWSNKTLSMVKLKGFCLVHASDTNPCSDTECVVSTFNAKRKIFEYNNKAYQLPMTCCTRLPYRLVKMAKTKWLINWNAYQAWKNLCHQ